jgi:hypothetical protein
MLFRNGLHDERGDQLSDVPVQLAKPVDEAGVVRCEAVSHCRSWWERILNCFSRQCGRRRGSCTGGMCNKTMVRKLKPMLYAEAAVPHYWRLEFGPTPVTK